MWVIDTETLSFLSVNDAAVHHYGYSREEFMGMTLMDIRPPEYQKVLAELVRSIPRKFRRPGIVVHKKKDGTLIDVDITTSDIEFDNRKARLVLAYDVTESKTAETALFDSEHKLRAITDTATDAIIMIDGKGHISYWNIAAGRIFGFGRDEVIGKDITIIIPQRHREAHKRAFNRFIETGRAAKLRKTYEIEALKKDGTEIPVELSISGVLLKGACHAVGVVRDISERKKIEHQLLHSQRMEAVGQLSGGIAHDFNNILSAIIGYGQILLMKMKEGDPLRVNVDHLLEATDRATHLTRSLLAFSRKQNLNPRYLDLKEIVLRVEKLLSRVIGEDIELKTVFRQDRVMVNADSGQLEQVLMNLATNARDAMPAGGSFTIELDTMEVDNSFIQAHGYGEQGRYAVVSVADTGDGMNEETRKRVFEPFFTTKEVGKGTGLGLSIVYGIVKQHHGFINVYSEPGKGTTFKIYLPLVETEHEKSDHTKDAPEERPTRGTETVMLAEDDKALRRLSQVVLEEFGYTVIIAEDGEDAVRKFRERGHEIQMVILDMIMPRKSGKEAYDEIQKIRPGVKALFVSGYTADKVRLERIPGDGVDLLLKPHSPQVLVKKVREILDRKSVP